jgi:hypothetical protein
VAHRRERVGKPGACGSRRGGFSFLLVVLFAPLLTGKSFSMVAAHMYAQYPWSGITPTNPRLQAGLSQTDSRRNVLSQLRFATNAIRNRSTTDVVSV